MELIPNPLHPAVVHFPIVLILLGALAAVVAVFWRNNRLPVGAAVLLVLGALGAWAAVESGESSGGLLEGGSPQFQSLVDAHETWAGRTLAATVVAAVAALGALLPARWPRLARGLSVVCAVAAVVAACAVFETGRRGGTLVYRHAAGVQPVAARGATAAGPEAAGPPLPAPAPQEKRRDID